MRDRKHTIGIIPKASSFGSGSLFPALLVMKGEERECRQLSLCSQVCGHSAGISNEKLEDRRKGEARVFLSSIFASGASLAIAASPPVHHTGPPWFQVLSGTPRP